MVKKTERHVRLNWESAPSDVTIPSDINNLGLVRYHFVVVDDRDRPGVLARVLNQMQQFGAVIQIRSVEGKVEKSKSRYLFESYDCTVAPRELDLTAFKKPVKKDSELRERKVGTIEDYVRRVYNPEH